MKNRPLLLVVDDEPAILHTLKQALEDEQFAVQTLSDGHRTLDRIGAIVPDLVLLDIFMPQCNGIDLLSKIKLQYPMQKVMVISGYGTIPIATDALKKGATDFIEKPLNLDEILAKISFLKQKQQQEKQASMFIDAQCQKLGIVGTSALFRELMHQSMLIAQFKTPVLIYGPSGSGKTLLAKYIHAKSSYAQDMFTEFDCATMGGLTEELLKKSGTLFLKHIQMLTQKDQQRLLTVLSAKQEKLRVIASASLDLFEKTQHGTFDISLFCKLQATPIQIPSLNKRGYDIPLLVHNFMECANRKYHKSASYSIATLRFLRNHQWHGDVWQLENYINQLVQNAAQPTEIIDVSDSHDKMVSLSVNQV